MAEGIGEHSKTAAATNIPTSHQRYRIISLGMLQLITGGAFIPVQRFVADAAGAAPALGGI